MVLLDRPPRYKPVPPWCDALLCQGRPNHGWPRRDDGGRVIGIIWLCGAHSKAMTRSEAQTGFDAEAIAGYLSITDDIVTRGIEP